jgi:ABC-type transporter Mla subunit MlaD
MARGYSSYGRRRSGPPMKLIGILAAVGVVVLIGVVFWASGQAESRKPEQTEIRVEATNVGPH